MIRRAAKDAAQLVVLPECVWPAYCIGSKDEYFAARAGGMPGHETFVDQLAAWAQHSRIMICAGYIEEVGERLFNTACLISRSGEMLGAYRKCFLWNFDRDFFEPGDRIVDPFNGSGTTGAAAIRHGRCDLGIEKSTKFAELARLRLKGVASD